MNLLFVCTGNTCRSAMAEEAARILMRKMGIEGRAASAGVYASEGMPASIGAQSAISMLGGDLEGHRATPLTPGHIDDADWVFCMSAQHKNAVLVMAPNARDKTHTLLGFSGKDGDIADPFGGDDDVYVSCLAQIGEAVRRALEIIANGT